MEVEKLLLSKKESAAALGISIRSIENFIRRKECLPESWVGGRLYHSLHYSNSPGETTRRGRWAAAMSGRAARPALCRHGDTQRALELGIEELMDYPESLDCLDRVGDEEGGLGFVIVDDRPAAAPPSSQVFSGDPHLAEPAVQLGPAEETPADNAILTAALAHASRGGPVFPLHWPLPNGRCSCGDLQCERVGKHPLTNHGLKDATTDFGTIRGWWRRWPDANLGLLTGSVSGLVVLDVDGDAGRASLTALTEQSGGLSATIQSKTRRGTHFFFNYPQGREIKGSAGKLGLGLDIRANGNYVVVPTFSIRWWAIRMDDQGLPRRHSRLAP
jgi:Bifunctional DNA primase/polymerase, N-terminal